MFGKSYDGALKIEVVSQKQDARIFFYNKGGMKAWYGVYRIKADEDMLGMILDTGIGAHAMQGVGFVERL